MINVKIQPLSGLGESACERILSEQDPEPTTASLPMFEEITNQVRQAPGWLPWAIAGGFLYLISRRRN